MTTWKTETDETESPLFIKGKEASRNEIRKALNSWEFEHELHVRFFDLPRKEFDLPMGDEILNVLKLMYTKFREVERENMTLKKEVEQYEQTQSQLMKNVVDLQNRLDTGNKSGK